MLELFSQFFQASGSIVKISREKFYIAFYDSETHREEFASCSHGNDFKNGILQVRFDAFQLDPKYPDFCDGIFVSWIVTCFKVIENPPPNFDSNPILDPFELDHHDLKFLGKFEMIPTFVNGTMEIYGFFQREENEYETFMENLDFSCEIRKIGPQIPIIGQIYACNYENTWFRILCRKLLSRKLILADIIDYGEINQKIEIKDLIFIPDYLAQNYFFIKRFHLAGCKNILKEEPRIQEFLYRIISEEKNQILKCNGYKDGHRILIDVHLSRGENLTFKALEKNLAWPDLENMPQELYKRSNLRYLLKNRK